MKKDPFEDIGGYANIDIADMLQTLQEKPEFKKPEKRTEKWDRLEKLWDEFGKLIQPDYLDDANLEGILRCMDSILAIDPKDYGALHNKGIALGYLNRKEEALACFDEARHSFLHLPSIIPMNPFQDRRPDNISVEVPLLGFGDAHLGELFEKVDEAQSSATLKTPYYSGIGKSGTHLVHNVRHQRPRVVA